MPKLVDWTDCPHCGGDGCTRCRDLRPVAARAAAAPGNAACDICGYIHPKPDVYGIVCQDPDGVYRCKCCRAKIDKEKARCRHVR